MKRIDRGEVVALLDEIAGRPTWGARIGEGSMLTIEFGQKVTSYTTRSGRLVEHGEWHLWLYDCAWRVEDAGVVTGGRNDEADHKTITAALLNDRRVDRAHLSDLGDVAIVLDGGIILRSFAAGGLDQEHWILFVPDGRTITATSHGRFAVEEKPR